MQTIMIQTINLRPMTELPAVNIESIFIASSELSLYIRRISDHGNYYWHHYLAPISTSQSWEFYNDCIGWCPSDEIDFKLKE